MSRKGKYIIEIAERHTHYTDDGKPYNLYRVKGFNSLVLDDYGLAKLEKYNENNNDWLNLVEGELLKNVRALDCACKKIEILQKLLNKSLPVTCLSKEEWKKEILKEVSK